MRRQPRSTLFPYTTLFRSEGSAGSWTLTTSTASVGTDTFALQAVFGSSNTAGSGCPNGVSSDWRSEEDTSELQTRIEHVCWPLLEKKKVASGGTPNPDVSG